MRKKYSKLCIVCRARFTTFPSVAKLYCSPTCAGQGRRQPRGDCSVCGTGLALRNSTGKCKPCFNKSRAIETLKDCEFCGIQFPVRQWRINQGRGRFCSRECTNQFLTTLTGEESLRWAGGKDRRRGVGWKVSREWALVRANQLCEQCGAKRRPGLLNVHHIKAYKDCVDDVEDNSPNNLIVLCRACHAKEHLRTLQKRNGNWDEALRFEHIIAAKRLGPMDLAL